VKALLSGLWNDPAKFRAAVRAVVGTVGALALAGLIPHVNPDTAKAVGAVLMGGAWATPAGQQNALP
jgi:hypothetical protein